MISFIIALFLFTACTKEKAVKEESKEENQVIVKENYIKAVFERHNNIYFYDEKNGQLQPIGESTKFKELTTLSPDKRNVAFKYFYEENNNSAEVIIYNLESKSYRTIPIKDEEMQNIVEFKWINEQQLLVAASINPSVLKYEIYDINSMEKLSSVKGLLMEVTKEQMYLYAKGDKQRNNNSLYLGDKLIYKLENSEEEVHFAAITEDKKKVAFRTISYGGNNGEIKEFLYLAELDMDNLPLKKIEKIDISSNVLGNLEFDKENNLYVKGEEYVYKLENSTFVVYNEVKKEDLQPTEEQLLKFKKVLKSTFTNEFVQEYLELEEIEIFNIYWL